MSSKKLSKTQSQTLGQPKRFFSESFKREKVKLIVAKKTTVRRISDLYKVSRTSVYSWVYKYSQLEPGVITVVQMESEEQKTKYLESRVAELERIIGQKQLELDLNEKTFELISEELGYDVKKKHAQTLLNGSA